mmetsp:Transcript_34908/g.138049  ORF Transcript_34908/g.138049 Transcript_34908/m.138049 type:complete len:175 (+) Transcript_34908:1194-1718(+)
MRKNAVELESETMWQACTTFIQKNFSLCKSLPSVEETRLEAENQGCRIFVEDERPGTPELDEKSSPSECREYMRDWVSREDEERPTVEDVSRKLQNRLFSNIRTYHDTIAVLWVAFLRSHGSLVRTRWPGHSSKSRKGIKFSPAARAQQLTERLCLVLYTCPSIFNLVRGSFGV